MISQSIPLMKGSWNYKKNRMRFETRVDLKSYVSVMAMDSYVEQ
jgi:hypothetical protein